MKKLGVCCAAAVAAMFVSTHVLAGPLQLVATDAKGKQAKAGKYSKWTRVYRAGDLRRLKKSTRSRYSVKATLCKTNVVLRPGQQRWIAAHRKAKHKIVLRERKGKSKRYQALCAI